MQAKRPFHLLTISVLFCALAACDSKPAGDSAGKGEANETNDQPAVAIKPGGRTSIIPLPISTIESKVVVGGEVVEEEEQDYLGVFALPYNSHPGNRHPTPPLGYREEKTVEELDQLGEKWKTTRIRWTLRDPEAYTNFDAKQITIWVSDRVASPQFQISMRRGPDLGLPGSTLKFEYVPKDIDPDGDQARKIDEATTLSGEYLGSRPFELGGRDHTAFRYSYSMCTKADLVEGELWIAATIPGGIYRHSAKLTGSQEATLEMQVKAVEPEELRADLQQVEEGGFAFALPEGWQQAEGQDGELLRLEPIAGDEDLNRAVTLKRMPADGKDYQHWGDELSKDDSKYESSYDLTAGLGDSPIFDIHYWSGSESRVQTTMTGTVRDDQLYLISHWQDGVAEQDVAGSDVLGLLVESWRWLQE